MMANALKKVIGKCTFPGGVHPPHRKKYSESVPVRQIHLQPGQTVLIPMAQHIGAPCKPTVEKKQAVTAGEVVGSAEAFVSAPVHSPVNGEVKDVAVLRDPTGGNERRVNCVTITVGQQQPENQVWTDCPDDFEVSKYESKQILDLIRQAGIVGQGGAAFPAAVKLTPNPEKPVDTLLLNGCECEPYLTSDHRLMLEAPSTIVAGARLAQKAVGAQKIIIAIEDNKPDAIDSMLNEIKRFDDVQIAICQTKYPQGGEKQLIKAVMDREVPTGGLPSDVGVVVSNVGTCASILWACYEERAVTQRIVTVTGKGVVNPGNFRVPVGMMLSDLLQECGGLTDNSAKVLLGGPMMGPTAINLDVPITKGTSGITVLTHDEVRDLEITTCIRCGRCVDICPMNLVPTRMAHAVKARNIDDARAYDLMACMECGCCTYVCPAQIPLLQYLRAGKMLARK